MTYLTKLGLYRRAVGYFMQLFPERSETDWCYLAEMTVIYHDDPTGFH